jgi:DNA-binding transcriptional LysR family regulator
LRQRRIEMVLGRSVVPSTEPDVEAEALFNDQIFVVAGLDSPWARRRALRLADLVDAPWIMPPYGSFVGGLVQEAFREAGLAPPEPSVSTHSIPVQVNMMTSSRHLSVLPGSMLHFSAKRLGLKVLRVHLRHRPSPVAIITLKDRSLSPLAQLFIETTRNVARPLASMS